MDNETTHGQTTLNAFEQVNVVNAMEQMQESLGKDNTNRQQLLHEMFLQAYPYSIGERDPDRQVYLHSLSYAREHDELARYKASRDQMFACAAAIDQYIACSGYQRFHYDLAAAAHVVLLEYGLQRVELVLANEINKRSYDGRFFPDNLRWAASVRLYDCPMDHVYLNTHPVILDSFVRKVREIAAQIEQQGQTKLHQQKKRDDAR